MVHDGWCLISSLDIYTLLNFSAISMYCLGGVLQNELQTPGGGRVMAGRQWWMWSRRWNKLIHQGTKRKYFYCPCVREIHMTHNKPTLLKCHQREGWQWAASCLWFTFTHCVPFHVCLINWICRLYLKQKQWDTL